MASDFYQIVVLYALTFLVILELHQLKRQIQRVFQERQNNSTDEAKLQALTLMIIGQQPDGFLTRDIVGDFDAKMNRHLPYKEPHFLDMYHIPNLHRAYDLLSELRINQLCRQIVKEIPFNGFVRALIPSKLINEPAFHAYEARLEKQVEKETVTGAENTGITFLCFRSAEALLSFKTYIAK